MISRRQFLRALGAFGLAGAALDLRSDLTPFPATCCVRPVQVPAPAGWSGRTALFISDIHYTHRFGPDDAVALNAMVRARTPDVVIMGGDLAQTPDTDLDGFFHAWSPGCPTLFAPGNHDLTSRGSGRILQQARANGLIVLSNSRERWNGVTFIGFPSALREAQRLSLLACAGFKVVLGHEPDEWDRYLQPDLLHLAGHTHGGQVRLFGRPLWLPTLGRKYPLGEYSRAGRTLLVSAGVGYTDVPVRLNCPPEILQLEFC